MALFSPLGTEREIRVRGSRSSPYFRLIANQLATESQGIETGRTYAHTFRYVSYGIGHNKTNRRTVQIADGQFDATNPSLSSSQHPPSRHQRPAKSVSFPALFRVPLLRFGRLSLRSILRMFFWEGTNRRPPRRLIQPLGIEGNPWSRSTSTSTSSRCPRYRTCCACRRACGAATSA